MRQTLREYCVQFERDELLEQWHQEKNGTITPDTVSYGSQKRIWWQCEYGHEWETRVYTRTVHNTGCPYCKGKRMSPGADFAALYPDLAIQWHPTKNGDLTPQKVPCGTTRKVWWKCARGHEWQANIDSRVSGKGCPYCGGLLVIPGETDLETIAPEVAKQWHPDKNGKLQPSGVSAYSNKKAWWRCDKGHEWQVRIASRTYGGNGCPFCSGRKVLAGFNDLQTKEPRIAAEWHPTKNGALEPTMVTVGSTKRVWWKCPLGHEWKAIVYSRATGRKCGCPECAGRAPRTYD